MTQQELDNIIQLAVEAIAQFAAEKGKTPQEVLADSNAIDDATLARALAFQAELNETPPA